MEKQIKSKKRVADHGEVFTNEREVNAMLDMIGTDAERVDSRCLEPACGDGNFLVEILRRKLNEAKRLSTPKGRKNPAPFNYEKNAVLAISSIYGVDLLMDNVLACRERLFGIWDKEYKKVCKKETNDRVRDAVRFILSRNIVCGNALTMRKVDEEGYDTFEPIVFSEWAFITGTYFQRRDYIFEDILNGKYHQGLPAIGDEQMMFDAIDTPEPDPEGIMLDEFPAVDYRRIHENG